MLRVMVGTIGQQDDLPNEMIIQDHDLKEGRVFMHKKQKYQVTAIVTHYTETLPGLAEHHYTVVTVEKVN